MKWSLEVPGQILRPCDTLSSHASENESERTHISKDELLRIRLCFFSKEPLRIKLLRIRIQLRITRDSPAIELLIKSDDKSGK
jgi:hypothetical protein